MLAGDYIGWYTSYMCLLSFYLIYPPAPQQIILFQASLHLVDPWVSLLLQYALISASAFVRLESTIYIAAHSRI